MKAYQKRAWLMIWLSCRIGSGCILCGNCREKDKRLHIGGGGGWGHSRKKSLKHSAVRATLSTMLQLQDIGNMLRFHMGGRMVTDCGVIWDRFCSLELRQWGEGRAHTHIIWKFWINWNFPLIFWYFFMFVFDWEWLRAACLQLHVCSASIYGKNILQQFLDLMKVKFIIIDIPIPTAD